MPEITLDTVLTLSQTADAAEAKAKQAEKDLASSQKRLTLRQAEAAAARKAAQEAKAAYEASQPKPQPKK